MKSWIAKASQLAFKGLHATESVFGLPKSISDPLHYREDWETFLVRPSKEPTLWIHGASVGELEDLANFFLDAASLAEAGYSIERLIVTASSPSAKPFLAKLRERFPLAYAGPIPSENSAKIERFLQQLQPELLVLSHSDLWPNLMHLAQNLALQKGIIWMPAKASSGQGVFESIVDPKKLLAVGARSATDLETLQTRLEGFSKTKFVWIGNPRLDRIASRISRQRQQGVHVLEESRARPDNKKLSLLLGSAWPEDASVLADALKGLSTGEQERIQIVAIPHVTEDMHVVASIQHLLPMARILRIQGVLLEAYQDFSVAFVGGGFRTGLHSVLEPALWGMPIICGPQLRKQPEAGDLQSRGALYPVISPMELEKLLKDFLTNTASFERAQARAREVALFMKASTGASKRLSHLVCASKVSTDVGI